jgi:ATP-dependent Lhr-like helicase
MALVLQTKGLDVDASAAKLSALFPELPVSGVREELSHMCTADILSLNDGLLGIGARGEKLYGRQNFLDLLSSFASPLQLTVRHGSTDLGRIDPIALRGEDDMRPVLLLGGHSWHVTNVEWSRRIVWVEPAKTGGKAKWFGSSRALGFELCQAIKRVLADGDVHVALSKRATEKLSSLREAYPSVSTDGSTIEHTTDGRTRWWTFAGARDSV